MADPNASDLTLLERAIAILAGAIGLWRGRVARACGVACGTGL